MHFKHDRAISLNVKSLKSVEQFPYLSSNILPTESDVNIHIEKTWTTIVIYSEIIRFVFVLLFSEKICEEHITSLISLTVGLAHSFLC